jgi:CRP/FNR family transcriptional regulator, cyclic AMP receptor protein
MDGNLLVNIPMFAGLPPAELEELAGLLKRRDFKAGQPIFWVGDAGTDSYIIQSGRVTMSCPDEHGRDIILDDLGPGDFLGEICLLDGGPHMATARAQTDVILGSLSRAELMTFLKHWPDAANHVISALGAQQRAVWQRLRGVTNANAVIEERATTWQRVADVIASVSASRAFVLLHMAWFAGWMILNQVKGKDAPDPYPFGLLTMIVSLEAIFLSIFVLISQTRAGQKDRIRADLDYQVNLKAQHEIMRLHEKFDQLAAERRAQPRNAGPAGAGEPSARSGN